jgi:hypothetical protein
MGQSIRANASYMTSAAAGMLAQIYAAIISTPKWKHFPLAFGSLFLCR